MDILPTVAQMSGASLPAVKLDGHDIGDLMRGEGEASPYEAFYYYFPGQLHAVRVGDWKLHVPHPYRVVLEQGKDGTAGRQGTGHITELTLYNLKDDIGETTNVASQHPEVVEQLLQVVEQARADLGDTLTKRKGANVRPPGRREAAE